MYIGSPGTPGSNKVLTAMDIATEDIDVCPGVGLWDANERYQTIPRSDAAVEVVVLPGLAVMVESLRKIRSARGAKGGKATNKPLR